MDRLNQAKELVPHGEWQNWLKDNFQLSYRTAAQFMQIADRFGNMQTSAHLKSSQMVEMLALPAEETEQFIAEKAAEGKPVEDMTVKQLREEVQQWKSKAEVNDIENFDTPIKQGSANGKADYPWAPRKRRYLTPNLRRHKI